MATTIQILTGALLQIQKSAMRSQDSEGTLRKIHQLAGLALKKCSPTEIKTSVETGELLLRETSKKIRDDDVEEAAQEMADVAKAEKLAEAKHASREDEPLGHTARSHHRHK